LWGKSKPVLKIIMCRAARLLHPSRQAKEDQLRKDTSPKKQRSTAQIEHDAEIAARARLTASLREQRLKRDAELLASGVLPEPPPKRAAKKKPA
jgi:hypothetical protein